MAVFTAVTLKEAASWLTEHYTLGEVADLHGISSGIENSNFFLTTRQAGVEQAFVLTVFERLSHAQLPYYLHLMQHLAHRGIAVPEPQTGQDGNLLQTLKGKPAAIVNRLPGSSVVAPQPAHCTQIGTALAHLHLAGRDFLYRQPNLRSLLWWQETVPQLLPHLTLAQQQLLTSELQYQAHFFASADYAELDGGPCHCDLFRDNALFEEVGGQPRLGGIFDFYFAGCDKWLFDLAVTVNDWCIDHRSGELDIARTHAMLSAYHAVRPLSALEERCWPAMLRAGALRFWISRLWDVHLPRDAEMLQPHDPTHFERVLRHRIALSSLPWIH